MLGARAVQSELVAFGEETLEHVVAQVEACAQVEAFVAARRSKAQEVAHYSAKIKGERGHSLSLSFSFPKRPPPPPPRATVALLWLNFEFFKYAVERERERERER